MFRYCIIHVIGILRWLGELSFKAWRNYEDKREMRKVRAAGLKMKAQVQFFMV